MFSNNELYIFSSTEFTTFAKPMTGIWHLLRNDFILDFRGRFLLGSVLVYALVSTFMALLIMQDASSEVWNTIYWILICFSSVVSSVACFIREGKDNRLYYYHTVPIQKIYFAKWIYLSLQLIAISFLVYGIMSFMSFHPIENSATFILVLILGSTALSSILSFTSSLAALGGGQNLLSSILSFPLMVPVLLILHNLGQMAMNLKSSDAFDMYLAFLIGIMLIALASGYILIQFSWRN